MGCAAALGREVNRRLETKATEREEQLHGSRHVLFVLLSYAKHCFNVPLLVAHVLKQP